MQYLVLLRAINVSGKRIIKMEQLKMLFESLNFKNVKTFIQSGNILIETENDDNQFLKQTIESAIETKFGFEVKAFILSYSELEKVILNNPFVNVENIEIEKLYISFLSSIPDETLMNSVRLAKTNDEEILFASNVMYLFCPHGYGNTKLNNTFIETKLKLFSTTRNWKTLMALIEMMHNIY